MEKCELFWCRARLNCPRLGEATKCSASSSCSCHHCKSLLLPSSSSTVFSLATLEEAGCSLVLGSDFPSSHVAISLPLSLVGYHTGLSSSSSSNWPEKGWQKLSYIAVANSTSSMLSCLPAVPSNGSSVAACLFSGCCCLLAYLLACLHGERVLLNSSAAQLAQHSNAPLTSPWISG